MAKKRAFVNMHNGSNVKFCVRLYHWNADYGTQCRTWTLAGGQLSQPQDALVASFEVVNGVPQNPDYWWASLSPVEDASGSSWHVTQGDPQTPTQWAECQLQPKDEDATMTFSVDGDGLEIKLFSGGTATSPWINLGGNMKTNEIHFTHVFVLMLENHSFDNIFAFSGISGITAATTANSNSYSVSGGTTAYHVYSGAPASMPTDPGHEFLDTLQQLTGHTQYDPNKYPASNRYPGINNEGFAANYATSTTEGDAPQTSDIGDIMACFHTAHQLPVIYTLATQFAVCDHWFSSMPGPTWPNRYFVHGASSAGLDDSPSQEQMAEWETGDDRFIYPNGSLYDRLNSLISDDSYKTYAYRLYQDHTGSTQGEIPQVASIENISWSDVNDLDTFANDLKWPYPYRYTFIEPNWGEIFNGDYENGTSQHPMDGVAGGEGLIKKVYEAIRNSPLWETSVLIVTYDEHGGFYDSVAPTPCVAPHDGASNDLNTHGFNFTQYGVRVPAVVVSCRTGPGTVSHTVFDHASIPATVLTWLGAGYLTQRDKTANSLIGEATVDPRTNCPKTLPNPVTTPAPASAAQATAQLDQQPLPAKGNLIGLLAIAAKADFELSSRTPGEKARIAANLKAIKTTGQAKDYMLSVKSRVDAARAAKEGTPPKTQAQTA